MTVLFPFFAALIAGVLGYLLAALRPSKNRNFKVDPELQSQEIENREVQSQIVGLEAELQQNKQSLQKVQAQSEHLTLALQQSGESHKRLTQRLREYEEEHLLQQQQAQQLDRTIEMPLATAATALPDMATTPAKIKRTTSTSPFTHATSFKNKNMPGLVYLITDQEEIRIRMAEYFAESEYTLQVSPSTHLLASLPHLMSEKRPLCAIILDIYESSDDQWNMLVTLSQQKEVKGISLLALVASIPSEKEKAIERGATQPIPWPAERQTVMSILSSAQIARNLRNDLALRAARLTGQVRG